MLSKNYSKLNAGGMFCRYIRTPIIGEEAQERLSSRGIEFALEEDAAKAMLKIASDTSVNGKLKSSSLSFF